MPTLLELTQMRSAAAKSRAEAIKAHTTNLQAIDKDLAHLDANINLFKGGLDLEMVAKALEVLEIRGDALPYSDSAAFKEIVAASIGIISNTTNNFFQREHIWVKLYDGFGPQSGSSEYGFGPRHGSIVFGIGFKRDWRDKELGPAQREACLYYLYNLVAIEMARQEAGKAQ